LLENCDRNTTLITGGPLKNLGRAIAKAKELKKNFEIGSWYAQGIFARANILILLLFSVFGFPVSYYIMFLPRIEIVYLHS
jgi:hypothetical protein